MAALKAKRAEVWPWEIKDGSAPVRTSDITRDGTLQARDKMHPALASKYAHEMQAGALFPPLALGEVGGKLYLLDGWHRYDAAVLRNGHEAVEAVIRKMTPAEAIWAAASANLSQGQGLTSKEKRNVLGAYIKAKKHRIGKSGLKSYRDIGKELAIKLGTLYRWVEADHPKLFRAMQRDTQDRPAPEPPAALDLSAEHKRRASHALKEAGHYFSVLQDPEARFEVIEEMRAALVLMQKKEHHEAEW